MTLQEFEEKEFKLIACKWEGHLRCIYLNDFRIAGSKPWGGGETMKEWKVTGRDILRAFPEIETLISPHKRQT